MVDYVIINGTAAELTNVNAGGTDVAAYTISGNVTLTDAELAIVASLDGVAVMQASASAAEKAAVGNLIVNGSGAAPTTDYYVANGTGAELTNVNAGGDDIPENGAGFGVALTPSELKTLAALDGVAVAKSGATYKQRRGLARALKYRKARSL